MGAIAPMDLTRAQTHILETRIDQQPLPVISTPADAMSWSITQNQFEFA